MENRRKHKDFNQIAKNIVDMVTSDIDTKNNHTSHTDLTIVGRSGGLVGGVARANSLTPERRKEIAKKAAEKRWGKHD